ncbi:MAG TPA: formyltetrahydrofolate deformylase [Opitutaceae bacterium]
MVSPMSTLITLLHGPDQPGLVARVSGWIFERGGNIIHADQHRDQEEGVFFQRVEWTPAEGIDPAVEGKAFETFATTLGMHARVATSEERPRVLLMVSKSAHCFHDLVLRFRAGEFPGEIVAVISNHRDLESEATVYGLPFFHVAVNADTKAAAEVRQLEIIREHRAQLVVLARYMQVLSEIFLNQVGMPVINIHHSFLPAFAGGRPYHQAYKRGVKLIGATAHYATAVLDDGPIIAQDVTRVTHRQSAEDMIRKGRDLEKLVLAQAVRWHLENRILVYNNKTVVFD